MTDESESGVPAFIHPSAFILHPCIYASSSIGRAAVSKAAGSRFDSLPACDDRVGSTSVA